MDAVDFMYGASDGGTHLPVPFLALRSLCRSGPRCVSGDGILLVVCSGDGCNP
jgi:hypothetical protein